MNCASSVSASSNGRVDQPLFERGLVERDQRVGQAGVIVEIGRQLGLPAAQVCSSRPSARRRLPVMKSAARRAACDIARLFQRGAGQGQGVDRQAVPTDQHFVVQARLHALGSHGQQLATVLGQLLGQLPRVAAQNAGRLNQRLGQVQDIAAPSKLPASLTSYTAQTAWPRSGPSTPSISAGRPDVKLAFVAFAVGILRAVKAALGVGHLAQDKVAGFPRHAGKVGVARGLKGLDIAAGQQGVVVEHFFEMRHQPALVDRVAMKSAAEMIVDAAGGHLLERAWSPSPAGRRGPCGATLRSSSRRSIGCGNFGAEPNPPC